MNKAIDLSKNTHWKPINACDDGTGPSGKDNKTDLVSCLLRILKIECDWFAPGSGWWRMPSPKKLPNSYADGAQGEEDALDALIPNGLRGSFTAGPGAPDAK
jgi:hypothetical protein